MIKIMILGAGVYQVPLIEAAKSRGMETIAVSPKGDYPGLKIADKVYYIDVRDEEKILEAAKIENISGITTDQTDMAIRTVAYVAEELGLPGIGYDCAKVFTDKWMMRKKTAELGLATIRAEKISSLDQGREFLSKIGKSVIIKPLDNQGSRGVSIVESEDELEAKFHIALGFSKRSEVIIEEYICGKEIEVDSIVVDYTVEHLMHADLESFDIPDTFASTTRLFPSSLEKKKMEGLLDVNKKTLSGFGLKQGLTHCEYMIDEKGEIYLIEAAARGGGTYISSHLTKLQTGLDTSPFLLDIAINEVKDMPAFSRELCHSGYVTFYLPKGEVISKEGVDEIDGKEYVYKHMLDDIMVGMKTSDPRDKTSRYAIILKDDSREKIEEDIEEIRQLVDIKVRKSDGSIEGPIWR
jgi:biotin carboxylase